MYIAAVKSIGKLRGELDNRPRMRFAIRRSFTADIDHCGSIVAVDMTQFVQLTTCRLPPARGAPVLKK
jgi:hypothetical protein